WLRPVFRVGKTDLSWLKTGVRPCWKVCERDAFRSSISGFSVSAAFLIPSQPSAAAPAAAPAARRREGRPARRPEIRPRTGAAAAKTAITIQPVRPMLASPDTTLPAALLSPAKALVSPATPARASCRSDRPAFTTRSFIRRAASPARMKPRHQLSSDLSLLRAPGIPLMASLTRRRWLRMFRTRPAKRTTWTVPRANALVMSTTAVRTRRRPSTIALIRTSWRANACSNRVILMSTSRSRRESWIWSLTRFVSLRAWSPLTRRPTSTTSSAMSWSCWRSFLRNLEVSGTTLTDTRPTSLPPGLVIFGCLLPLLLRLPNGVSSRYPGHGHEAVLLRITLRPRALHRVRLLGLPLTVGCNERVRVRLDRVHDVGQHVHVRVPTEELLSTSKRSDGGRSQWQVTDVGQKLPGGVCPVKNLPRLDPVVQTQVCKDYLAVLVNQAGEFSAS